MSEKYPDLPLVDVITVPDVALTAVYEQTGDDYLTLWKNTQSEGFNSVGAWTGRILFFWGLPLAILTILWFWPAWDIAGPIFGAVLPVFLFFLYYIPRDFLRSRPKAIRAMFQEQSPEFHRIRVAITPNFLIQSNWNQQSARLWCLVKEVIPSSDAVYIIPTSGEPLLIPRRAFSTWEAFREFSETARSYHAANAQSSGMRLEDLRHQIVWPGEQ